MEVGMSSELTAAAAAAAAASKSSWIDCSSCSWTCSMAAVALARISKYSVLATSSFALASTSFFANYWLYCSFFSSYTVPACSKNDSTIDTLATISRIAMVKSMDTSSLSSAATFNETCSPVRV